MVLHQSHKRRRLHNVLNVRWTRYLSCMEDHTRRHLRAVTKAFQYATALEHTTEHLRHLRVLYGQVSEAKRAYRALLFNNTPSYCAYIFRPDCVQLLGAMSFTKGTLCKALSFSRERGPQRRWGATLHNEVGSGRHLERGRGGLIGGWGAEIRTHK